MTIKSHCFRRNAFEEKRSGRHCDTVEEERYTRRLGYHGYTENETLLGLVTMVKQKDDTLLGLVTMVTPRTIHCTSRLGYHDYTEEGYTIKLGYHGYTENDTQVGLVTMVTQKNDTHVGLVTMVTQRTIHK